MVIEMEIEVDALDSVLEDFDDFFTAVIGFFKK